MTLPSFRETLLFNFFLFACAGWVMESVQESIVRKRFVNKGFFRGPWVPVQGIGGLAIYFAATPLKKWPVLVFFAGMAVGTLAEYITAIFLEKCFGVKGWDYRTYPHTRWCHFQGRICLTISLFFGLVSLAVLYAGWDSGAYLLRVMGSPARAVLPAALSALLCADVVYSCAKTLSAKRKGIPLKRWGAFSVLPDSPAVDYPPLRAASASAPEENRAG